VKRRLQVQATNDATARTRRSLGNSCLDGNKVEGGSLSIIGIEEFDFTEALPPTLELFSVRRFITTLSRVTLNFTNFIYISDKR
jgi:hypothetical protein